MMILMVATAGAGKTHWLGEQPASVRVSCTHAPHRAILCAVADALKCEYAPRDTIDVITKTIMDCPTATIALDDIDRTGGKLLYSLLVLAEHHDIIATATIPRRVAIITERGAAQIIPAPHVSLAQVARENAPELTPVQIRRVSMTATSPRHAAAMARAIAAGQSIPTPPTADNKWLTLLVAIALIAFLRTKIEMSPVTIAVVTAAGYILRRLLWKSI